WDSELLSTIGAAGELFSIRRCLYEDVPQNTILDDFIISMRIAKKGFKIAYEPNAYAIASSSLNVHEEFKRKIRIAGGGIQSILLFSSVLNPIKTPLLTFQYVSQRVLRWRITSFLLPVIFFTNISILDQTHTSFFTIFLIAQIVFYLLAIAGST